MEKNRLNYGIINFAALMILLYISFSNIGLWWGIIAKVASILAPFIIGFAFAYAFTPLVHWLENRGFPKVIALLTVISGYTPIEKVDARHLNRSASPVNGK